jgi:hypothetical protein
LFEFTGENANDQFGSWVDGNGNGDVDNDGRPDILVAAPNFDAGLNNVGKAYMYSGSTGDLLWSVTGLVSDSQMGRPEFCGDLNGDGFDDVLIRDLTSQGRNVHVHSGINGAVMWTLAGDFNGSTFGHAVGYAGDVDNDGNDDIIIAGDGSATGYTYLRVLGGPSNARPLIMTPQFPIVAGSSALILVTNAISHADVLLFSGTGHGRSYLQVINTLDIQNATGVGTALANSSGEAVIQIYVPPSMSGTPVWLQALDAFYQTSNVVLRVIQ